MKQFTHKKAFYLLWAGQSLSLLGSGLTRFAIMIWAYQQDGSVTSLVLLGFFSYITFIVASPFSGVLIDRLNRKWVMFFADLCAGLATAMLLMLSIQGNLQLWHLYLAGGLSGIFQAFQSPAFYSSISQLVPKEDFTRCNALVGLSRSATQILAPAISSAILAFGGLNWVMKIDLISLLPGLLVIPLVCIPKAVLSETGKQAKGNFWHEFRFGFRYIFSRPGLRTILFIFVGINLFAGITYMSILSPMILTRTGGNQMALGTVLTIMGIGGILGGLAMTLWKAPKRKAALFVWTTFLCFGICDFLTASSHSVVGWSVAGFISEFAIPFMISPYYAIWQEQVPGDVQGRVFSVREMIQMSSSPVGFLLGGFLADRVFEPLFAAETPLAWLVGSGAGAGMAVMFLSTALLGALTGLFGILHPAVHQLDKPEAQNQTGALPAIIQQEAAGK